MLWSTRGESGTENNSNVEEEGREGDSSGEDPTVFSGDGSFDTIKRKKNKVNKLLFYHRLSFTYIIP